MTIFTTRRLAALAVAGCAALVASLPAAAQQQTIRLMGWVGVFDFQKAGWARIVSEFERQNPGVKIDYVATPFEETLNQATIAILGNNAPDIIQVSSGWVPQLQAMNALEPIDNHLSKAELAQFPSSLIDGVTIEGKTWALPWIPGPIFLAYNRELLRAAGLNPDSPPRDFASFDAAVRKICALGDRGQGKVFGVALRSARHFNSVHWAVPIAWALGGDIVDDTGKVQAANPGMIKALEWYRDITKAGCTPENANINESRNFFAQGRAGFVFEGPWVRGLVDNLSGGKLKVARDGDVWIAPMPAGPDGKVRQIANSNELVLTAQSKNKALAAKFVNFILGNQETVDFYFESSKQPTTGRLDVMRSGAMGKDAFTAVVIDVLPYSSSLPIKHPKWTAGLDVLAPVMQKVIQGADAATELRNAQRDVERAMR
jgi:multiple sugar transport system substrate-binding protein